MKMIHTIREMRAFRETAGGNVPFVPTMGALHEGHVSLVRQARVMADARGGRGTVIASIFVNPTQFGPGEDFAKYPRTLEADAALLEAAQCDAVFVPSAEEIYPGIREMSTQQLAAATSIDPGPLGSILEGEIRPGHFRGVCTVVAKLLNITAPTHMLLGRKDFQQQLILRRMCADLNMPVEVVTCDTLRESDGLAMSSRNRYLSRDQRVQAVAIYQGMQEARAKFEAGERHPGPLEAAVRDRLQQGGLVVQYATVRRMDSLEVFPGSIDAPAVMLVAGLLGSTRLIDNMVL